MASISDILIARGAAQANSASRQGNIYADLIRNASSAPGQVVQQVRADQRQQAQDQEMQQRLGLQNQELQLRTREIADQEQQRTNEQAGQQALSAAIQKHTSTDPDSGHLVQDHDAIYADVAKVNPTVAENFYTHATKHAELVNQIQNDTLAANQKKLQLTGNLAASVLDAPPEQRPAAYAAMRGQLDTLFKGSPEISQAFGQLPPVYSPDLDARLSAIHEGARTDADRAKSALDKASVTEKGAQTAKLQAETAQIGKPKEMTPYEAARLGLDTKKLNFEEGQAKIKADEAAAAKAKGKQLPVAEVDKISEIDKSIQAVRDLRGSLATGSTGLLARAESALVPDFAAGLVPGAAAAKATQADIVRAQQVVGRIIHGGVMRANDQAKAEQYMPKLGDSKEVIASKLDAIEKMGLGTRADHLGNLGKTGWDVSGLDQPSSAGLRKEIPGHPGVFAVSKDGGASWQAE